MDDQFKPFNFRVDFPLLEKEDTRKKIALFFTIGFLVTLFISAIFVTCYNIIIYYVYDDKCLLLEPVSSIVALVGIVGTPFGFIIGYYFKSK
jgi:hypothetical protein